MVVNGIIDLNSLRLPSLKGDYILLLAALETEVPLCELSLLPGPNDIRSG